MKKYTKQKFIFICLFACCVNLFATETTENAKSKNKKVKENEIQEMNQEVNFQEQVIENNEKNEEVKEIVRIEYIEKPVYIPESEKENYEKKNLSGINAVKESIKSATVSPDEYKYGTFYYQYNENLVYEIYAQPFHLTDICLERGEVVIAKPLLSEDERVWELTAGVARDPVTNEDVQHIFIKPAYSNIDSTMIIITDRRVYHFRIKSFKDTHMAMVKFTYPGSNNVWAKKEEEKANTTSKIFNPELISFDYKLDFNKRKKPHFVPLCVYDDAEKTYIQVDKIVLQKQLPVLFNEKNEILNYTVKENVFIIPRLIDRVTLRLGNEKVVINKIISKKEE